MIQNKANTGKGQRSITNVTHYVRTTKEINKYDATFSGQSSVPAQSRLRRANGHELLQ